MVFDWKKLEREDQQRNDRAAPALGVAYCTLAVIGFLVILLTRRWESIVAQVIWLVIGPILLLGYWLTRNRRRRNRDT